VLPKHTFVGGCSLRLPSKRYEAVARLFPRRKHLSAPNEEWTAVFLHGAS